MKGYRSILVIPSFDKVTIQDAKELFEAYHDKGIIKNDSFDDNKWLLTNEISNTGFVFSIPHFKLGESLDISKDEFISYLKSYAVFRIGELDLASIQQLILNIRKVANLSPDEFIELKNEFGCAAHSTRITEFFSMLPAEGREQQIHRICEKLEYLEDYIYEPVNYGNQRVLASFESYFLFDMLIDKFWNESNDLDEKLFYFPLWLWWKLTVVLPTRPTAFTLTPRNCLTQEADRFFLTMRQSILKGKDKKKGYKIDEDYRTVKYEIPKELAYMIDWYIRETEAFPPNPLGTLFRLRPHYKHWDQKEHLNNIYYTYTNLSTCLRYFYAEIIEGRYGYEILYSKDKSYLDRNEIQYINLGDTRHLAMINLISSGSTATVAQILAGHNDINMSSHYFSNVKQMIKCRIRVQYTKRLSEGKSYSLSLKSRPVHKGDYVEVDGGRCYSSGVRDGIFSDCIEAVGENAAIGVCEKCYFFMPEGASFTEKKKFFETEIDTEINNLKMIVNRVRSERGYKEEIEQSLKKLRAKELSYSRYLMECEKEELNE